MDKRGFISIIVLLIAVTIVILATYGAMSAYGVIPGSKDKNATSSTEVITTPGSALERARNVQNIVHTARPEEEQ